MRGVALNHLVGRDFSVGGARLRGHELCEPFGDLARMTGKPTILAGLVHQDGLRAETLAGGCDPCGRWDRNLSPFHTRNPAYRGHGPMDALPVRVCLISIPGPRGAYSFHPTQ